MTAFNVREKKLPVGAPERNPLSIKNSWSSETSVPRAPYFRFVSILAAVIVGSAIAEIAKALQAEMPQIELSQESEIAKLSVVGIGMMKQSGVAAKVFNIFADNNIEFKQVTTSEISISYTINSSDKQKAVDALAKALEL